MERPHEVWYAAYGSSMSRPRFLRVLAAGAPGGGDARPPRASTWLTMPGGLYFAKRAPKWRNGGVAFYDPDAPGEVRLRLYRITGEQYERIFAIENGGWARVDWARVPAQGTVSMAASWYGSVAALGIHADLPVLSFTHAPRWDSAEQHAPTEVYLKTILRALLLAAGMQPQAAAAYLLQWPPAPATWTQAALETLATALVEEKGTP